MKIFTFLIAVKKIIQQFARILHCSGEKLLSPSEGFPLELSIWEGVPSASYESG
jgi:hypothetical protein